MRPVALLLFASLSLTNVSMSFEHFITRKGNKLYDGEREFRFMGANMPGLVLPYDYTLHLPERMRLPTPWEQEDAFKTLDQMNFRVVRTWNLPIRHPKEGFKTWHYLTAPRRFNEEAFKCVDHLFALANKYRVRVIFDLTAEYGEYLGGISNYAAHRNKTRHDFYTDPELLEDYRTTIRYVLNRKNTITGVRYRDEKAVLAWQFGNEMYNAPEAWLSEMAAYIKKFAPNHLVAETRHRPGQPLLVDPNIDLLTRHLYTNYAGVEDGWINAIRREVEKLGGQRPLFIGEFGPYIDGKMFTHDNLVTKHREFLDYLRSEPAICGALLWSMYFHHENGGFYWHQIFSYPAVWSYHWPGFPSAQAQHEIGILRAMRETAFKIQGLSVPPVPVPDAPQLLPVGEVPLLTWRGSAGASGYDIYRAAKIAGPWSLIATNVSDADVAYRPLFSDTTALPGRTYFYRVCARNSSGVSPPSNVAGPVFVRRLCLVDEMQDFSRVAAKSDGLTLGNDYNGLYAEYLFRAAGHTNDWLTYKVPGNIELIKAVAFCPGDQIADLQFHVGNNVLPVKRAECRLPSPSGGPAQGRRRTLIEYEAAVPERQRELKIFWPGPAELDRVEIYYR